MDVLELFTDCRFNDTCVSGITAFYKDIKLMMCRDPTLDVDQMQSTIRHLYVGELSISGAKV